MKITQAHICAAMTELKGSDNERWVAICQRAIEIAIAEADVVAARNYTDSIAASEYITASEARALGAGNAEYHFIGDSLWRECDKYCRYAESGLGEQFQYRAIQRDKLEAEWVRIEGVDHDPRYEQVVKPADLHAELRAQYEKQVADGTTDYYVWESNWRNIPTEWHVVNPQFDVAQVYRCTPKPTTTVNGETMAVEMAQKLFEETKGTHDWFFYSGAYSLNDVASFTNSIIHDITYKPKAKKLISWAGMPVGVMTDKGSLVSGDGNQCETLRINPNTGDAEIVWSSPANLRPAPADQQPWLNWRGGECPVPEGLMVEVTTRNGNTLGRLGVSPYMRWGHVKIDSATDIIEYRVVGIESGYTLGGGE